MVGEKCVTHARLISKEIGYEDQTGNLRSSTGYVVYEDGRPIFSSFEVYEPQKVAKDTIFNGKEVGRALADKIALENSKGMLLVVVAGMFYSKYLEMYHGRDVLTSAEIMAAQELPRMMRELTANINAA